MDRKVPNPKQMIVRVLDRFSLKSLIITNWKLLSFGSGSRQRKGSEGPLSLSAGDLPSRKFFLELLLAPECLHSPLSGVHL